MKVTVYSKPFCVACDATKRLLTKLQISHTVVDVTEDAKALAYVKSLGYSGAPVVVAELPSGIQHWAEFREAKMKELSRELQLTR
ncbi:glutaredoxin family protein [Rhodococcus sp. IEGM 1379]|uniref:glutaredoxin family protein n=1 Tax=Rhodococcus sp. IEGM 1379 TaxID=3047086 RepID=UPI0024B8741A|nr:glutaredoxin family protein [Rhodococcus sp. IEGM 1379]MDI9914384.1 glutaredoxin family protein [Rhodococcus sp. IEGM 1379]